MRWVLVLGSMLFASLAGQRFCEAQETPEAQETFEVTFAKIGAAYQEHFSTQGRDEPWATEAEALWRDVFSKVGISVSSLECRETLCKMVTTDKDFERKYGEAVNEIGLDYNELRPAEGSSGFGMDLFEQETGDREVYVNRAGYMLTSDFLIVSRKVYRSQFPEAAD